MYKFLFAILFSVICTTALARVSSSPQGTSLSKSIPADSLSYLTPKDYIIGGVTVTGVKYLNKDIVLQLSKLTKGDPINLPSERSSEVIKNLYSQGLFDDVQLNVTKINLDTIYLNLNVSERPRLSRLHLTGIRKGEIEDVQKKLADRTNGKIVNENLLITTTAIIKKHFNEKGYLNTTVKITQRRDPGDSTTLILDVAIDKKSKVMINDVIFEGNKQIKTSTLRKYLSKTRKRRWYNVFGSKKFKSDKYEEDKQNLVAKMQAKGYRDAEIVSDSVWNHNDKTVNIKLKVYEGHKYYFGNISWSGNAQYSAQQLNQLLHVKKGDVFSEEELNKRISGSPNNDDISTLYLNEGFLTFTADPVQVKIYNDTVDLDMRVYEGPQYTINRVLVKGNDVTNDPVILRDLQTLPGQKFSKSAIINSQRIIGQLGNFDETKTEPKPINLSPQDGTVDILYNVVEKPSDQIELSGGFGGGQLVGTVGLTFNNFSLRNIFNLKAYKPLPKGDGEKLSLRGQSSGRAYQNFSFTYSDPWLGGKKPIYFALSAYTQGSSTGDYYAKTDPNYNKLRINGIGITLGKRLKWPDNLFQLNYSLNVDHYDLYNYGGYLFSNGTSYNIKLTQELSRSSLDAQIFPTAGSNIKLTIQATPPYSLFNNVNYNIASPEQIYHFVEYYKVKYDAQWFSKLAGKFVLMSQVRFGFLGMYNSKVGPSPFERFKLGGDGMQSYQFLQGSDIIGLRGYQNFSIVPEGSKETGDNTTGSTIYSKYTLEIRHPIINTPSATVFMLAFAEGGNTWDEFSKFNPFNVRRSVGVGARVFLPIFGLLGLDYGYGFDSIPGQPQANKGQIHFSIAQSLSGGFN